MSRVLQLTLLTIGQQALGVVGGILVIRALSKTEYAQYSIALGVVGAIAALAEAGVTSTVLSEGGRRIDARERYARLLAQALVFRRLTNVLASLGFLPIAVFLLMGAEAQGVALVAGLCLSILTSFAASTSAVLAAALRLEFRYTGVAITLLGGAAFRCAALLVAISLSGELSFTLVFGLNSVSVWGEALVLRRLLGRLPSSPRDQGVGRALRVNALRQVPNSAFYVLQGQVLAIALIAVGDPISIAEVNALARYSLGFVVVSTVVSQLVMTRLARADTRRAIVRTYLGGLAAFIAVGGIGLLTISLLSQPLLWILGEGYDGLGEELLVVSLGGLVGSLVGLLTGFNQARAWLRLAWLQIPIAAAWILALLVVIRPADVMSAAWFSALVAVPGVVSMAICAIVGMKSDAVSPPRTSA